MTSRVPGFDDRLDALLDREAAASGEDPATYVRRAVASRLVADLTRKNDPELVDLLTHIAEITRGTAEIAGGTTEITGGTAASDDPNPAVTTDDGTPRSRHAVGDAVVHDPARLRALLETGLLDARPQDAYDRVVALAAEALAVPAAAVSLVDTDRQFFSSAVGLSDELAATREVPLERSVCQYAVSTGEPVIVEDARFDPLLSDHPTVTDGFLVAYAGIPLVDGDGHAVGTLCVWDSQPRQWTTGHVQILTDLAGMIRERMFSAGAATPGD